MWVVCGLACLLGLVVVVVCAGWLCVSGGWHIGGELAQVNLGLACFQGSFDRLVPLRWLCVSGGWHICALVVLSWDWIGLFPRVLCAAGAVMTVMCEW